MLQSTLTWYDWNPCVLNFNFDMPGFVIDQIMAEIWPIKFLAWIHSTHHNSTPVISKLLFDHLPKLSVNKHETEGI